MSIKIRNQVANGKQMVKSKNIKKIGLDTIRRLLIKYEDDIESKKRISEEMGISLTTLYRRLKQLQ